MTVCLLIQCVLFIFSAAAGGEGQIRNTENRCILRTWRIFVDLFSMLSYESMQLRDSISKKKSGQRQIPHLCSSRNKWTLIKEQSTEIPHAPISPARHTARKHELGHINVGMAQVDTTENKELKNSPWSAQSSGFISRLNHSGRKDVGRSEVKKDSIVQLLIQIVIISRMRVLQKCKGNVT